MTLFDFNDPFFRPLWIRILVVVLPIGWGLFEFAAGNGWWGAVFCGLGALAFYGLFISFEPRETEKSESRPDGDGLA